MTPPRPLALLALLKFAHGSGIVVPRIPREATMEKAATDIYTFENLRANGFTHLTVETATDAYVIEVKRDSTPRKAIEQIRAKEYTDRFRVSGKPITLIGMAFSTKKHAVSGAT